MAESEDAETAQNVNPHSPFTVEYYKWELAALIIDYNQKHKAAPLKRGWNKMFGVSIESKADLSRSFNQSIRSLDEQCFGLTKKHIWNFEEDEGIKGSPMGEGD